jgi:hypothetical protein
MYLSQPLANLVLNAFEGRQNMIMLWLVEVNTGLEKPGP